MSRFQITPKDGGESGGGIIQRAHACLPDKRRLAVEPWWKPKATAWLSFFSPFDQQSFETPVRFGAALFPARRHYGFSGSPGR